ncbi:hypothetical protein MKX08_003301 [Trichoderma sp. CBMAI-0020]|nr:hypothetical protein MKX08_003301 [Trichoderma sp. CBMAI-0020]
MNSASAFSPVTFNDHAGKLWIVTILALIYSTLAVMARAYIKYKMLGLDDLFLALATILHLAQSIAIFVGLNNGLGKFNSITPPEQWATSSKCTLAAVILTLLALSFAKCSVLALILRIIGTKNGKTKIICITLMAISAAWGVASSLAFLINCRSDTLLTLDNIKQCPNQEIRWAVITAVDVSIEILTWMLIVQLSWTVNMSFVRKCQVAMVFSFRLLLVALSVCHLVYFYRYPTSAQPQFAIASSLLFQQVMIVWSLISATVPNMKNFLKSFSIGMGFPLPPDLSWYESNQSYQLQSLERQPRGTSSTAAAAAGTVPSAGAYDPGDSGLRNRPYNWRLGQGLNEATAKGRSSNNSREELLELAED